MRNEQEMLELILNTAKDDERIRAVMMNGSRVNPNASRDIFQDYDIVYFVSDVAPFRNDHTWINRFGEIMILQMPETMQDPPAQNDGSFGFLTQFTDGNRIDLTLFPVARLDEFEEDSLSKLLLDKDGLIEPFAPPNESSYLPSPPTAKIFSDCCNEFWWVSTYVAKGLWREEIIYAKYMLDEVIREQLLKMVTWYIGVKTQFSVSPGKLGKHFPRYLEPDLWDMMLKTYADAGYDNTWDALLTMGKLFRTVATAVADHFGYDYPYGDDERVTAHLQHVRRLPRDAEDMYPHLP